MEKDSTEFLFKQPGNSVTVFTPGDFTADMLQCRGTHRGLHLLFA